MRTNLILNALFATLALAPMALRLPAAQDAPPAAASAPAEGAIAERLEALPAQSGPADPADLAAYNFDLIDVMQRPQAMLPAQAMGIEPFADGSVLAGLLRTSEPLTLSASADRRERLESESWFLDVDSAAGSILATRKPRPVVPLPQDRAALTSDALSRLAQFGIPPEEMFDVLPRELKRQVQSQRGNGPAEVIRYKTFVTRGINGIPVQGHRAVITHHLDGSLQRALVKWPPLARSGHQLSTDLSLDDLMLRAAGALQRSGIQGGRVALRWKYVPTLLDSGEATLELVAAARVAGRQQGSFSEESQEIDVRVDAR